MKAVDVIKQIKRLPQRERNKVAEFIQQDRAAQVRYADSEAAKAAAEEVFAEHPELFRKLAR